MQRSPGTVRGDEDVATPVRRVHESEPAPVAVETRDGGGTWKIVNGNTSMGGYSAHDATLYLVPTPGRTSAGIW